MRDPTWQARTLPTVNGVRILEMSDVETTVAVSVGLQRGAEYIALGPHLLCRGGDQTDAKIVLRRLA